MKIFFILIMTLASFSSYAEKIVLDDISFKVTLIGTDRITLDNPVIDSPSIKGRPIQLFTSDAETLCNKLGYKKVNWVAGELKSARKKAVIIEDGKFVLYAGLTWEFSSKRQEEMNYLLAVQCGKN